MKDGIHQRLKAVRTALELTQRGFTKAIYLEQSSYARIEQGGTNVNERIIELVCSKYNVSKTYLKEGKGQMFAENAPPDIKLERLSEIFKELNGLFQDYLIIQAKELLKVQEQQNQ